MAEAVRADDPKRFVDPAMLTLVEYSNADAG